ncbi:type II secretion system protein GspL [Pseudomonas guariconensis]|uniref:type II secretion system protein GspL n=1 Tax=Pseudomonas guariconensis TaxID=1288410 RepID=UPI0018AB0728|nr:type II secretion system protein GspL [Pseudomonas guariconensis]MBF8721128.1 hypothetical protein [Pseudomonas guariconensis]
MSENWLYLLPAGKETADAQWPVWVRTAGGEQHRVSIGDVASILSGAAVVVVPMEMVGTCEVGPLPGRRPKPDTLAYAAEDQLAAPLETVHLAFGPADEQKQRRGLVIDRDVMDNLLALLQAQGVEPLALHVDADLLTGEPACALWLEGRWLIGGAGAPRLAATPQAAQALAPQWPTIAWLAEAQQAELPLCTRSVTCAFDTLRQGRMQAIDLLQGAYRRRRASVPWRALAVGVSIAFAMVCVADYLRAEWLLQRTAQLQADNRQAFQRWAPGQPVSADLASQIRALEYRPHPATAIEGLASLGEQLVETGNLTVAQATLSPVEGWRMEVLAQGFEDLERLRQRVPAVLIDQARQDEQGVRATLTWKEAR